MGREGAEKDYWFLNSASTWTSHGGRDHHHLPLAIHLAWMEATFGNQNSAHKKRHSGRVECSTGVPLPDPILVATDHGCGMLINEFRRSRRPVGNANLAR